VCVPLRRIPRSIPLLLISVRLLFQGEAGFSRFVGLHDGTLRMNAIFRVRPLAADGTKLTVLYRKDRSWFLFALRVPFNNRLRRGTQRLDDLLCQHSVVILSDIPLHFPPPYCWGIERCSVYWPSDFRWLARVRLASHDVLVNVVQKSNVSTRKS
jgi:hypothetical protein